MTLPAGHPASGARLGVYVPQGWRLDLPAGLPAPRQWALSLEVADRAVRAGYGALWTYDHLHTVPEVLPRPVFDPLVLLGALAARTTEVRLGTMALCVPFRHPALLARTLACLDLAAGGRLEVGLGAGWDEAEARAWDVPFPATPERIARCGEAARLLDACWAAETAIGFDGRFHQLQGATGTPPPWQRPRPPIWIAGAGERRTLWEVARAADGCSLFGPPERVRHKVEVLAEHCRSAGRAPASVRVSVVVDVLAADTEAAADLLAERFNRWHEDPAAYRARRLVGTPAACAQQLEAYLDAGVEEVCCYFPHAVEGDALERFAAAARPRLARERPGSPAGDP